MRPCPSCRKPGIREHSVLVPLASLTSDRATSAANPPSYARCARCDAAFRYDGPETLVPEPTEALGDRTVWLIPPWKTRTDEATFAMSWDVVEAFFENQAVEIEWIRPLRRLLTELRDAGFDAQLRAGQSLNALGLSRSREHGLRPEQSHLFLSPQADGSIVVEGHIRGAPVRLGPMPPLLGDSLRALVDDLASLDIDYFLAVAARSCSAGSSGSRGTSSRSSACSGEECAINAPTADAQGRPYRDAAQVLVPDGVPIIRIPVSA